MITPTTKTLLDFTRERGRKLLDECAAAEADRSLYDRDTQTMAMLFGHLNALLGQLLDELDAHDTEAGAR